MRVKGPETNPMMMIAAGFKMNNLKAFPFSRLPRNFQVRVIETFKVETKLELFNVRSGFRGYFARNGIFPEAVWRIKITLLQTKEGEENDLALMIYEKFSHILGYVVGGRHFNFLKNRVLFRNICSCTYFEMLFYDKHHFKDLIRADVDVKKISKSFPNLRFVKDLYVSAKGKIIMQEILEPFQFKVTRYAELHYPSLEGRHWEHLLANQLSNCEKVIIPNKHLIHEVPGMEIENDEERQEEILDAFREEKKPYYMGRTFWIPQASTIKYYRRKITDDEEMIMLVIQY